MEHRPARVCCIPHARRQRADGPLSLPLNCPLFPDSSGSPTHYTEVIPIDELKNGPKLGTPEAAVQAAVNLLAKVSGINETKLAYYLDMYYQLRDAYEAAKAAEQLDAQRVDDAPHFALYRSPACLPADGTGEDTNGQDGTGAGTGGGEPLPPPDAFRGFEPVEIKAGGPAAQAAAEKRRIKERLDTLRAAGVSVKRITKAANGNITEDQIREIIDCKRMPIAVYRVLDAALDTLEGPALEAQQLP